MKLIIDIDEELYKNVVEHIKDGYIGSDVWIAVAKGEPYEERQQGEWIDYSNTFYKYPECGYLLEKCCPQCQNKVILPKGGAE